MKKLRVIILFFPVLFCSCFPLSIDREIEVDDTQDWLYIGGYIEKTNISKSKSELTPPFNLYWQFDADGGLSRNCLSISDAILFASTLNGEAFAIDVLTGKSLGRINTMGRSSFSTPLIFDNHIIIASSGQKDSRLFSYSLLRGAISWQKNIGWVESSPVLDGENIFISSIDGKLHKVNAASGNLFWSKRPGGKDSYMNSFFTSPTIFGNKIFIGGNDQNMYAADTATGNEIWKFRTGGAIFCDASANEGKVYFGSDDKNFYCVDTSGHLVWKKDINTKSLSSSTFFENSVITAGVNGVLYSFDKNTGDINWKFATLGTISSSPLLQGNNIFIGSYDKNFYCIDAATGKELWRYATEGRIRTSAVIWKDYIFVAGDDKYIYCFSDKDFIKSSSGSFEK